MDIHIRQLRAKLATNQLACPLKETRPDVTEHALNDIARDSGRGKSQSKKENVTSEDVNLSEASIVN